MSAVEAIRESLLNVSSLKYQIIPGTFAINHDPTNFPDPDKFDPDRFIDPEDGRFTGEGKLFRFGVGKNRCLGEVFAQTVLFLFLTSLVREFRFELADIQCNVYDPDGAMVTAIERAQQ